MPTIDELQQQLRAATAEQRRLQAAIDAAEAAELKARVDSVCTAICLRPDADDLLRWIESALWSTDAESLRGALAVLLNTYFLAIDQQSAS